MAAIVVSAVAVRPGRAAPAPDWSAALTAYAADPAHHRRAIVRLGRSGTHDVPPAYALLVGDALLRSGRLRAAGALFDDVRARDAGDPWTGWAELGLGWTALARGDAAAAREAFASVAARDRGSRPLAVVMAALADAAAGHTPAGLAVDPSLSPGVRRATQAVDAYVRYWTGRWADAAARFDALAADDPTGPLADDARYAAARARWRAGDHDAARAALDVLARGRPQRRRHPVTDALVDLDPVALVRAAVVRYRELPLRPPDETAAALLDLDGVTLARAALRRIAAPSRVEGSALPARPERGADDVVRRVHSVTPTASPADATADRRVQRVATGFLAAVALALGWIAARTARRRT